MSYSEEEFIDRLFSLCKGAATCKHELDTLCAALGIEHRLTPTNSTQINGAVEQFNGRFQEVRQIHHFRVR